jgi:SRSO17 transposase
MSSGWPAAPATAPRVAGRTTGPGSSRPRRRPPAAGRARWLLVRRGRADGELAFSTCFAPASTCLVGLVRVAGIRWAIQDSFQTAKGAVGLDHYQVRRWPG